MAAISFRLQRFCCSATLLWVVLFNSPSDAATQNFSYAFDNRGTSNPVILDQYGGLPGYVAYTEFSATSTGMGAFLIFIPTASNTSYILSILAFSQTALINKGAILWMANRNHPVSGNFSLTLNQTSASLVLLDGDLSLAWSSSSDHHSSSAPVGPVSMELNTTPGLSVPLGTLLLSSNNTSVWNSSGNPTHTLMPPQFFTPGMSLTSWASTWDPAEGFYSLVMEVGGLALYYNAFPEPLPYWIWSYYDQNDTFGVAHTCKNEVQAFMTPDGGLILGIFLGSPIAPSNSTWPDFCAAGTGNGGKNLSFDNYGFISDSDITFLILQDDGNLFAYTLGSTWTPVFSLFGDDPCVLPNYCGPYGVCTAANSNCQCPWNSDGSFPSAFPTDRSQGCPPIQNFTCHDQATSRNQKFLQLTGVDYFSNKYTSPLTFSTKETCTDACLQNCSCLAAFWHIHTTSCFHVDRMVSLQGSLNSSYMAFLKVEDILSKTNTTKRVIAGVVSGVFALLFLCLLVFLIYRKKSSAHLDSEEEDPFWNSIPGRPTRYSYLELDSITNGFSEQLGKGGFGSVYAGVLQDGTRVAVKRLESLRQGRKEFRAEVEIMGGIHHYHLVELIGFCAQGSHRLLVYEYMANGSLDQWLYTTESLLNWECRYNIALGAARGLAYLHGECRDTIIHLDIKPQNILLDENYVAKVSDFGLSRLMGRDETHVVTTMRGTPGYLAPEWLIEAGVISEKCDVFSFGKLLMEILGARRNLEPSLAETERLYFPSWLYHQVAQEERLADLKELARVETPEEIRQARLMMKTAFVCVLEDPALRPSMHTVVRMLEDHVPELDTLQLSDLFQGLHFALRMPAPHLVHTRIEEALAPIYQSSSSIKQSSSLKPLHFRSASGGVMSLHISAR